MRIDSNSGNRPAFCANLKNPTGAKLSLLLWGWYFWQFLLLLTGFVLSTGPTFTCMHHDTGIDGALLHPLGDLIHSACCSRFWRWWRRGVPQWTTKWRWKEVPLSNQRPLNDLFVYQIAAKTKWYYACDSSGPIHRSTDTRHGGMTASGFLPADWDLQHLRSIPVVDWIVLTYLDLDHLWRSWHCPLAAYLFNMMSFVCGLLVSTPYSPDRCIETSAILGTL